MNTSKSAVHRWFEAWQNADYLNLPISDDFRHTSPYGTIDGKAVYLALVEGNKEQFLGHRFEIHEEIYDGNRAAVRYTTTTDKFSMEVSEWYVIELGLITVIHSYYNIEGEISEDRQLKEV